MGIQDAIETLNAYFANNDAALIQTGTSKHSEAAEAITEILETAVSDFAKTEAEAKAAESAAARAYSDMKNAFEVDQASKQAAIKADGATVNSMSSNLEDTKGDRALTQNDLDATLEYLEKVRKKCT